MAIFAMITVKFEALACNMALTGGEPLRFLGDYCDIHVRLCEKAIWGEWKRRHQGWGRH